MFVQDNLKLLYVWVKDYKNIKETGFHFSDKYDFNVEKIQDKYFLFGNKNESYKNNKNILFKANINILAIVGKNGSGKSSLLEVIYSSYKGFGETILVYEDRNEELIVYSRMLGEKLAIVKPYAKKITMHINTMVEYFSGIKNDSDSIGHFQIHKSYSGGLSNISEKLSNGFFYSEKIDENEASDALAFVLRKDKDFFNFLEDYEKFEFNKFRFEVDTIRFRDMEVKYLFDPAYQNEKANIISSFKNYEEYFIKMNNIVRDLLSPETNKDTNTLMINYSFIENINELFKILVNSEKNNENITSIFEQYFNFLEPDLLTPETINWQTFQEKTISFFKDRQETLSNEYVQDSNELNNEINELNKYNNILITPIIYVLNEFIFINHWGSKSDFMNKDSLNENEINIVEKCINEIDFQIDDFKGTKLIDYKNLNFLTEILPQTLQNKIYLNFYNSNNRAYSFRNLSQGEKTLLKFFTDMYLYFNNFVTGARTSFKSI